MDIAEQLLTKTMENNVQVKLEKMKSLKPKTRKAKRDDWKRNRKVMRQAKRETQERWYA